MDIDDIFTSNLLKAADLKGKDRPVVIATVERKQFNDGDKLIITFQHIPKAFVANKTNAKNIAKILCSSKTEEWIGKEIVLYATMVDFRGDSVEAIRVKPAPRPTKPAAAPAPKDEAAIDNDMNDNIPW